jgi:hypothetical protein
VSPFAEKQENREANRKGPVESSFEDELCGAVDDISDDKNYTNFNEFTSRYQGEKEDYFLEMDFPFQEGKRILVALATNKTKKYYMGVIVSVNKGERKVKYTRRIKNISMFIWSQRDDTCEMRSEDIATFLSEPIKSRRGGKKLPALFSTPYLSRS